MDKTINLEDPKPTGTIPIDELKPVINPVIKNDRKPIMISPIKAAANFNTKDLSLNVDNIVSKQKLPKGYTEIVEQMSGLKKEATDIYDNTIASLKPGFSVIKTATKKAIPFTSKFQPKQIALKLKQFTTADDKDTSTTESETDNAVDSSDVNSTLQTIFGAQRIDSDLRDSTVDVNRQIDREINKRQFQHLASIQGSIAKGIGRLVGYQDTVLEQFHKKSLDLQYRQVISARELLAHNKAVSTDTLTLLQTVVKNTSLPEDAKVRFSESFSTEGKKSLIKRTQDIAKAFIKKEAKGFMDRYNFQRYDTLAKKAHSYINAGKSKIYDFVAEKAAEPLEYLSGKYSAIAAAHPGMAALLPTRKASFANTAPESNIGNEYGLNTHGIEGIAGNAVHTVPWDVLSRKTLVEIIPGFMSRSLEQITNIYSLLAGNNQKVERQVYSTKHEAFVPHSVAKAAAVKSIKSNVSSTIKTHANAIVDFVDPDKTLTNSERIELIMELANDASKGVDFDPLHYADTTAASGLSAATGTKIAKLFKTAFDMGAKPNAAGVYERYVDVKKISAQRAMSEHFNKLNTGLGNFTNTINQYNKTGESGLLRDVGLLNTETNKTEPEYRNKLLGEILRNKAPAGQYTGTGITDILTNFNRANIPPSVNSNVISPTPHINEEPNEINVSPDLIDKVLKQISNVTSTLSGHFNTVINKLSLLDTIADESKNYADTSLSYLDRIANAVENIKTIDSTGTGTLAPSTTVANIARPSVPARRSSLLGGIKKIFNFGLGIRRKTAPLRKVTRGIAKGIVKGGFGLAKGIVPGIAKLGLKTAGYGAKKLLKGAAILPGRALRAAKGATWLAGKGLKTAGWAAKTALKPATWLAGKAIGTLAKAPDRAVTATKNLMKIPSALGSLALGAARMLPGLENLGKSKFAIESVYKKTDLVNPLMAAKGIRNGDYYDVKSGKVINRVSDIRGPVKDHTGETVVTQDDITVGLVNAKGKPLYGLKAGKGLLAAFNKVTGLNFKSPIAFATSLIDKFKSDKNKKDSEIIQVLKNIYKYLQDAMPVKDSEDKEAERTGGWKNIMATRKAKKEAAEKNAAEQEGGDIVPGGKKKGMIGLLSKFMNKNKASEEGGSEGSSVMDKVITAAKWVGGGLGIGGAATTAGTLMGSAATTEAAVGAAGALGAGEVAAGALGAGAVAGDIAAGIAMASNPIGWALLIGGGIYAGYKGYKYLSRRTNLQPLELLRYLQYGVQVDNENAVIAIRYFEDEIKSDIEVPWFSKSGVPKVDLKPEELWAKYCDNFGDVVDNKIGYKNFITWFYDRFLPVYVKHNAVAKAYGTDLSNVDDKLTNDVKFKYVNDVQFGEKEAALGMMPLSIKASPWRDIALADNDKAIHSLTEQIRNLSKRGEDVSLKNMKSIIPIAPSLSPAIPPSVKESPDMANKAFLAQAAGWGRTALDDLKLGAETGLDKGLSIKDKMLATSALAVEDLKEGSAAIAERATKAVGKLKTVGKIAAEDVVSGAKAGYKAGKKAAGKAVTWVKKNVVEPIAHSLSGLIQHAESGNKGYNAYNRGTAGGKILGPVGPRDLESMTISQILEASKKSKGDPDRLFAVGKYQMIPDTLMDGIKRLGIDPKTTLYDKNTQERLFSEYLLDKKRPGISAYIKGKTDNSNAALNAAASEWASLPDPKTGVSKYGYGNKASVSTDVLLASMNQSKALYKQYVASGMSESEAYQRAISTDTATAGSAKVIPPIGGTETPTAASTPSVGTTPNSPTDTNKPLMPSAAKSSPTTPTVTASSTGAIAAGSPKPISSSNLENTTTPAPKPTLQKTATSPRSMPTVTMADANSDRVKNLTSIFGNNSTVPSKLATPDNNSSDEFFKVEAKNKANAKTVDSITVETDSNLGRNTVYTKNDKGIYVDKDGHSYNVSDGEIVASNINAKAPPVEPKPAKATILPKPAGRVNRVQNPFTAAASSSSDEFFKVEAENKARANATDSITVETDSNLGRNTVYTKNDKGIYVDKDGFAYTTADGEIVSSSAGNTKVPARQVLPANDNASDDEFFKVEAENKANKHLESIYKTTADIGASAGNQRDKHLAEVQRTNDLLTQLLNKDTGEPNTVSSKPHSSVIVTPKDKKPTTPIVGLNRRI